MFDIACRLYLVSPFSVYINTFFFIEICCTITRYPAQSSTLHNKLILCMYKNKTESIACVGASINYYYVFRLVVIALHIQWLHFIACFVFHMSAVLFLFFQLSFLYFFCHVCVVMPVPYDNMMAHFFPCFGRGCFFPSKKGGPLSRIHSHEYKIKR